MEKRIDPIMLRISQEFYHIDRVLGSCETVDQLQNTHNWIEQILNNWEFLFEGMSNWKYNRKYKDVIVSMANILEEKSTAMCQMFQAQYEQAAKEKEPKYPEPVVIKGFAQ